MYVFVFIMNEWRGNLAGVANIHRTQQSLEMYPNIPYPNNSPFCIPEDNMSHQGSSTKWKQFRPDAENHMWAWGEEACSEEPSRKANTSLCCNYKFFSEGGGGCPRNHYCKKKFHFLRKLHRLFKPLGNRVQAVQTFWSGRGLMSSAPELQFNFARGWKVTEAVIRNFSPWGCEDLFNPEVTFCCRGCYQLERTLFI